MVDKLVYYLALSVVTVIRHLPLGVCFVLGKGIGALLWLVLPGYRKLARENIRTTIGDTEEASAGRLTFQHFMTMGANAVCAFKIPALTPKQIDRVARIDGLDNIRKNIAKGRGVLIAINHIGNWELYAQLIYRVPESRFGTVYQALRNKLIDDLINGDRRKQGVLTFDRKKGFNGAIALLREPGVAGVLVDQNAGDGGMWTPFFNRLSSTSTLAATLAMRTDAAVVPIAIYTVGFAKWRVVVSEELPWQADQPEKLTANINDALEAQIRTSPADWFWVHNRWKMPWPNFLTASQRRGTYIPPGYPVEKLRSFRIVVRSPNWLGDAVMSLPTARAFKLGRPDARLSILTPAKLAGLWKHVPEVDEVITFEPKESIFSVAAKLRGKFEVAVLFPNSLRSALEVWLAGIPRRVGYKGHRRAKLLNQIIPEPKKKKAPKPEHHANRYWRIAERCGAVEVPQPLQTTTPDPTKITIGVCPGAEYGPAKRWPTESFRHAMELVSKQIVCRWVIVGTAADAPLAEELKANFPGEVEDLTGKTSLEELIAKLRTLDALLTNDTGTMHLADFLGVPLVAVFGSTEPILTGPKSPDAIVLRHQVECSPCFLRECPIDFRCMAAISPEEAANSLLRLITRPSTAIVPPPPSKDTTYE